MKLAIVKPDHLGDLILSGAAIRALLSSFPDAHVLVAPKNLSLASYLFPHAEIRPYVLPHLNKGDLSDIRSARLDEYRQVVMLRSDNIITAEWLEMQNSNFLMPIDAQERHQTLIDHGVVEVLREPYDIDKFHFGADAERLAESVQHVPRRIGISIGSGFHANGWPVGKWVRLIGCLIDKCESITILCGPVEKTMALAIKAGLRNPPSLSIEVGSDDFAAFVRLVASIDLVIATDGGTAHLCSLGSAVLSVFGPSPYRRFAPFGAHNRLITRDMSCSPCCQYAAHLANTCLSIDCMTGIAPELVAEIALSPSFIRPGSVTNLPGFLKLVTGASHLNREPIIEAACY